MLRLIGQASSINVRKILWTCAEIGIPVAREDRGEAAALRALNPNGLVPVIEDEAGVLWESNTICRYLAAKHGRTDLLPAAPRARAEVERWMDWQATDLNASWRGAFMALVRRHPDHADAGRIAASARAWNDLMEILDGQLARTGAFVVGESFTLADIVLGLSVNRWLMTLMDRPALPAVAAYVTRLAARPGFREYGANGIP
ncbi:glutathione S-transferase [Roseomonas stagni]|uniref:Glutathione S-transferase n=1 Tax=Falsiroseomonas algicola TaxID=2716930 RepID=A0A6M1LWE0_9PROT|nr:glutathione S-transferase N-terminal domain-containing protein [Falsiroseomonas algicola]NGM24282.1 glutathione S-transferase [Falsiroseomonas algicola]